MEIEKYFAPTLFSKRSDIKGPCFEVALYEDHLAALRPQPQTAKLVEALELASSKMGHTRTSVTGGNGSVEFVCVDGCAACKVFAALSASAVEPQTVEGWLTEERITEAVEGRRFEAVGWQDYFFQTLCHMALAVLQAAPEAQPHEVEYEGDTAKGWYEAWTRENDAWQKMVQHHEDVERKAVNLARAVKEAGIGGSIRVLADVLREATAVKGSAPETAPKAQTVDEGKLRRAAVYAANVFKKFIDADRMMRGKMDERDFISAHGMTLNDWKRLDAFQEERRAYDILQAALAQAGEAQETWRDISSAPKDGTRLWGADARSPHPIYYSIQYQQSGSHGAGWYTTWDATYVSGAVTHYMPLPQPPKGL